MKFHELLHEVAEAPLFETGILLAGDRDPRDIRRQLSRWTAAGKIIQLKRGLYTLAPPYAKTIPHPFLIANRLARGSYVSLQSILSYYGLIPESVPLTMSITTGSPVFRKNHFGTFQFHHITRALFDGFDVVEVTQGQHVFLAAPEKALLDLAHLTPGGDAPAFLESLRLQHLDLLDEARLFALAFGRPKLTRAVVRILELREAEAAAYMPL